jgi:hypothetical protein
MSSYSLSNAMKVDELQTEFYKYRIKENHLINNTNLVTIINLLNK